MPPNPGESCTIKVWVQPKSSRDRVDGFQDGALRVRVTAAPTEGQANAAVIAILAKTLGVSKSRLEIIRGYSSRDKVVSVDRLTEQEVQRKIEPGVNS